MINNIIGLGSWRFLLAFFVVISHLYADMFGGPAAYSVWGFFVLSGFLMTEVLKNKYGFSVFGLKKFAFGRFLRIYPLYYLSLVLGILTIYFLSEYNIELKVLNPQFYLPENLYTWFSNITLLPLSSGGAPVPVSGALAVEVGVYILIPFMAYSKNAAWLGMILSLILSLRIGLVIDTFPERYSDFLTCYFAFAIGSLINHYKIELQSLSMPKLSILVWLLHCLLIGIISTWPWTYGLYISVILSAWVVISLYQVKSTKIDIILGDLSYPIYLLHTTVGAWLLYLFGSDRSFDFFLISFILTIILSYVLLIVFDHPIQKLKKKVNFISVNNNDFDDILFQTLVKTKTIICHKIAIIIYKIVIIITVLFTLFITYKVCTNDKLEIHRWGPTTTLVQSIPNIQSDGNAGLWIKTSMTNGLGDLKVYINGEAIKTNVSFSLITASIPKKYFDNEKELSILIKNNKGYSINVGKLNVIKGK
jgi:peptidoglycan/LPS O-acetylase OafA/YrhL